MYFTWYGQDCFKLQSGERVIICDPYGPKRIGLRRPSLKADIFILADENEVAKFRGDGGNGFTIFGPGEYEIKGVFIYGIRTFQKKTIFLIEVEGMRIGYLGEISQPLRPEEIKNLGELDVLLLPVGDKKLVFSPVQAKEMVEVIEPALVIPCCYRLPSTKIEFEPLEKFSREMGLKEVEKFDKLRLKKNDIKQERTRVVILNLA